MNFPAPVWKPWCGMEALYLGEVIVARASPCGGRNNKPRAIFNLASVESAALWRDYSTIASARIAMENQLAEWLHKAGLE